MLGQFALKWALENPGQVNRLMILNTPLNKSSKLRPELAAYKAPLPFMRPGSVSAHRMRILRGTQLAGHRGFALEDLLCSKTKQMQPLTPHAVCSSLLLPGAPPCAEAL